MNGCHLIISPRMKNNKICSGKATYVRGLMHPKGAIRNFEIDSAADLWSHWIILNAFLQLLGEDSVKMLTVVQPFCQTSGACFKHLPEFSEELRPPASSFFNLGHFLSSAAASPITLITGWGECEGSKVSRTTISSHRNVYLDNVITKGSFSYFKRFK